MSHNPLIAQACLIAGPCPAFADDRRDNNASNGRCGINTETSGPGIMIWEPIVNRDGVVCAHTISA